MNRFLLFFFLLFFSSVSKKISAQTVTEYLRKSSDLYYAGKFDSALLYAWIAEPMVADSTGRNSSKYGYYVVQYFAMNHEAFGKSDSAEYWYKFGMNMMAAHYDTASFAYGETLSNYGNMLNNLSRYSEAFPYLENGATIISYFPDSVNTYLASINNLATSYNYYGDYTKAVSLYQKCLDGIDMHPDLISAEQKNIVLQNLATISIKTGNIVNAEKYLKKTMNDFYQPVYLHIYFEAKKNLGGLYLRAKKLNTAEKIFFEIYNDTTLKNLIVGNANKLYASKYVQAIVCLGHIRRVKRDFMGAERFFRQAKAIVDTLEDARAAYTTLSGLALLYKESHQNRKADSVYENLFNQFPGVDRFTYLNTYFEYCENLVIGKQLDKAAKQTRYITDTLFADLYKNFPGMEESSQMQYVQTLNHYRNLLPAVLTKNGSDKNGNIVYAYNRLLQLKGLILTYQQRKLQILRNSSDTMLASLNNKWQDLKKTLYLSYAANKNGSYTDSLEEVAKTYDKLITAKTGVPVENISEDVTDKISKKLRGKEVAVEFVRYGTSGKNESSYGAFILRHGEPVQFVPLCSENSLQQCFENERPNSFNTVNQLSNDRKLYNLIWQPLTTHVKDAGTIYYSPDGLLNFISFDALAPADDECLITQKKLVQLSNLRNLLNTTEKVMDIQSASLWGSIDYTVAYTPKINKEVKESKTGRMIEGADVATKAGAGRLNSLANDEVPAIDYMMKQKKVAVTTYKNKKATETNFNRKVSTFKGLLHISSHGFYFTNPSQTSTAQTIPNRFALQQNPLLRSGLILSGGQYRWLQRTSLPDPEDGILTGYEIAMMDLSKVKLVVLSACETALGDIDPGSEGVLGLQRAFKLAGVDKMILTLWSVNTTATEEFMKKFYQALLENNDPTAALYSVKKEMAIKKIPPYAWAGFVLVE